MWTRVALSLVLVACGKSAEQAPERAEVTEAKPAERAPVPAPTPSGDEPAEAPVAAPADDVPPSAGGGQCTVMATAGRDFKQVSGGGPAAANVFQWQSPEARQQKGYQDEGFILTCAGSDVRLSMATSPTGSAAFGFGARDYRVGADTSPVRVTATMGNTAVATFSGMLSLEKFDAKRIAGRLTLYVNATVPPTDVFKLIADFDFTCSGLSGCK
jgi:hypothetical protein